MSPTNQQATPPPPSSTTPSVDRALPYASPRREPRRRGRWRVDWVIVVTAVICALWIWANIAFLLGQPHNRFASWEDELFATLFVGATCSSPAIVVFLTVVAVRLWLRDRRRWKNAR